MRIRDWSSDGCASDLAAGSRPASNLRPKVAENREEGPQVAAAGVGHGRGSVATASSQGRQRCTVTWPNDRRNSASSERGPNAWMCSMSLPQRATFLPRARVPSLKNGSHGTDTMAPSVAKVGSAECRERGYQYGQILVVAVYCT